LAGEAGTPTKRKRAGVKSDGRSGKKTTKGPWKAVERILGRWRIGGSEPYKVCERDEE